LLNATNETRWGIVGLQMAVNHTTEIKTGVSLAYDKACSSQEGQRKLYVWQGGDTMVNGMFSRTARRMDTLRYVTETISQRRKK
jgi:hypothetical protein